MNTVVVNQNIETDPEEAGLWCEIDGLAIELDLPETCVHYMWNGGQPCIHGPATFPRACLFSRAFVARLNFQPIFYDRICVPVIASRHGALVTLAVNSTHPVTRPHPNVTQKTPRCLDAQCQWVYQMCAMQWWDEHEPDERLWLGVWPN